VNSLVDRTEGAVGGGERSPQDHAVDDSQQDGHDDDTRDHTGGRGRDPPAEEGAETLGPATQQARQGDESGSRRRRDGQDENVADPGRGIDPHQTVNVVLPSGAEEQEHHHAH
jgi:hypothetical protein